MVGLVFAMQGAGLVIGPLVASIFLGSGMSGNLTWRLLLGLGAIPGLAVFYLRRQIHETTACSRRRNRRPGRCSPRCSAARASACGPARRRSGSPTTAAQVTAARS